MKHIGFAALMIFCLGTAQGAEPVDTGDLERIFLVCRHVGGTTVADDLHSLAEKRGASDAEMAASLMELAKSGEQDIVDARQRHLVDCAVSALGMFGGENERSYLLELMRTTCDKNLRHTALRACIRLAPDKWEEVVREVAVDARFDSYAKFGAFEEAFLVGKSGDEKTRRRVVEVMSELGRQNSCGVSSNRFATWISELEKP